MFSKTLAIFFVLISSHAIFSQDVKQTTISGIFPGAEGKTIRLVHFADQISYRKKTLQQEIIDLKGEFQLSLTVSSPSYYSLRIDHAHIGLYLQPGEEYFLKFDSLDFKTLNDKVNPYVNPLRFDYEIISDDDLNSRIDSFEDHLVDFFTDNFVTIVRTRNKKMLDQFKIKSDSLFLPDSDTFFENYYRYKFAYYYRAANMNSPRQQIIQYFYDQPILYHHTQYMDFFNTVFDNYIFAGSRKIMYYDLTHTVNTLKSGDALMDSLGKDTLFRNEVFRELVMLKGLHSMYDMPEFNRENVLDILNDLRENSKFRKHKVIAGNIIDEKLHLEKGYQAPSFQLSDDQGQKHTIPQAYRGKFLLLSFITSWCQSCLIEQYAIEELRKKYPDDLDFITVMTDRNKKDFEKYNQDYGFAWKHLYFNERFDLLDLYEVRDYPLYVLISRNGKIIEYPAPYPSGDLINVIERQLFEERRKQQRDHSGSNRP